MEKKNDSDSNKIMTPEEIAKLIESQGLEGISNENSEVEVTPQNKDASTGGVLTPEQIAALFSAENTEPVSEVAEEPLVQSVETIETLEQTSEIQEPERVEEKPQTSADASTGGVLTPEQIAALFSAENTEPVSEVAEEPLVQSAETIEMPEQIAELNSENMDFIEASTDTTKPSKMPSKVNLRNFLEKINFNKLLQAVYHLKKQVSIKNRLKPVTKTSGVPNSEEILEGNELTSSQEDTLSVESPTYFEAPSSATFDEKDPLDGSSTELDVQDDHLSEPSTSNDAVKSSKKSKEKNKKTRPAILKIGLSMLGILILISLSFTAGYFSRDYLSLMKPDPAKALAQAEEKKKLEEEKAKAAADEKRAQELAAINPKDYTSSMYLDSLILKGQAGKMTSIKLKKIDDVTKLSQFTKLKRIRLYDMKGNEDLSVIEKLNGVEEILIENSTLKNQFSNGNFKSVASIELTDCTVHDSGHFDNFKNVKELYIDSTKFVSKDGNVKIASALPSLESLTFSNCGEYNELIGVQNLKNLNTLNLSSNTVIKNTSYVKNPKIDTLTVDISFAKNSDQLIALAELKNLNTLTLEIGKSSISSADLSTAIDWIISKHPDVAIKISSQSL